MKNTPCEKCGRPTRLQSELIGAVRTVNGPPDLPLHIWNWAQACDASPKFSQDSESDGS
jgi:hypothetical protein